MQLLRGARGGAGSERGARSAERGGRREPEGGAGASGSRLQRPAPCALRPAPPPRRRLASSGFPAPGAEAPVYK